MVKKSVLVTGGLGCFGGGLCSYLQDLNFHVIIGTSRINATLPEKLKKCELAYTDFNSAEQLLEVCLGVDFIIHLATVNAQQSLNNPKLAIEVNGIGTYNLIEASINSKVKYFLYFSTAHIYGAPLSGLIDENTLPKPSHPYSIAHRLAEDLLLDSVNNNKINGGIIRLSNSIGLPLVREANCWMLFVNDACKQAIIKRCIKINSDPSTERDFIPMNSVFEIVESFLSKRPCSNFPVYNVGGGRSYSLLEITELIAQCCQDLFNFKPELICMKKNKIIGSSLDYSITKLKNEMEFDLSNDLIPSIKEILIYCQSEFIREPGDLFN